jgi:hypothetical protein
LTGASRGRRLNTQEANMANRKRKSNTQTWHAAQIAAMLEEAARLAAEKEDSK